MRKHLIVLAAVLLVAGPVVAQLAPERPNVILFLVDDMGWQDTSIPFHTDVTPFNRRYRTPNMEHLALDGVRFTQSYASAPVCTPTRTSIMTGQSPARSHITYWTLHKDRDTSRTREDIRAPRWNMNGLQEGFVTLPRLLQAAGYRTIHVGKAHFGAHGTSGSDPTKLGFDVNIAGHGSGGPASYYGTHAFSSAGRRGDPNANPIWDVPGLDAYHGQDIYLTEALAIEAGKAIEQALDDGVPFYLNMAPYAVHAPIMANQRHLAHYPDLDAKEAAYATMIETMDAALGRLLDTLVRRGADDRTLIIFSSDNGGLSAHARGGAAHTHNAPLRSGKGSAYEGGTRVPTIIAGPGVGGVGVVCEAPIISQDFFPTILAIAGVEVPPEHAPTVDGRDLGPLLRGQDRWPDERILGWHQPHQWGAAGPGIWPYTAIREGDWKLIYDHAQRRFELYDLAGDIGETTDLSATHPEEVERLAQRMDRWISETGAQLSIDKATNAPIEGPAAVSRAD